MNPRRSPGDKSPGYIGLSLLKWAAILAVALPIFAEPSAEERLYQHRNLGKAFYENPATQYDAVGEFKSALDLMPDSARERVNYGLALVRAGQVPEGMDELIKAQKQDPTIPHTWFNLGIEYKRASKYPEAIEQLEGMLRLVPDEAITHYNLGVLYNLTGQNEKALDRFEDSARLDPSLAGPHFQLATAYRKAKRADDAKREMAIFRELKKRDAGAAVPEDLEWSYYSEIFETIDPVVARDAGKPVDLKLEAKSLATGLDAASAGLAVTDADGDGGADLLAWSRSGIHLFLDGTKKATSGLEKLSEVVWVEPGDIDNDGLADLCVVTAAGVDLFRNQGGTYVLHPLGLPKRSFHRALWLDYDHDYDVDLFLLGAKSALFRNEFPGTSGGAPAEGGFSDRTADFPFVDGEALDATRIDLIADTQGMDLAVTYKARKGVLYRDRLGGKYERQLLPDVPAGARKIVAHDADHDGWTDLTTVGDAAVLLINNHKGGLEGRPSVSGSQAPALWADLSNRGVSDLVSADGVSHNRGVGEMAPVAAPSGWPKAPTALASADFNSDGRPDLAAVSSDGELVALANTSEGKNRWLGIGLEGVKNLKLAPGAEVEVKAGASYQKKIYHGVPLHFGLGSRAEVDAVRVTWPNGLIQNESKQPTDKSHTFKEAQRLSGSCPMIYTWNGEEFEFITDVLGVAPLGASAGDGQYFPVDHDEIVQIAAESLVPRDGQYEIRVVEELREVAFIDEMRLIAVDHPESIEIFTNDKFKGPPFPEFRLFGVERKHHPVMALDHRGQDVTERVSARDRIYPDGFTRDYAGVAEKHYLELDFGHVAAQGDAILVLAGWVDWADGSTFLQASQGGGGLIMPYLQVKNEAGEWQTVIEDMGIPAGKPKTIVVDLSGKFLSDSREVRIVSNLCVYWDEIFLSEEIAAPEVRMTDLHASDASLSFQGFSKVVIHPERKQPEHFVYAERRPTSMWNPTPGLYTRYGDVRPLLNEIDDRLVIMGSGDELRLLFDADALPSLPEGWRRDFLLFVDGWAKDGDANTAHSQTVGPLPYHGMPQYPYAAPHRYPDGGEHNLYREHYNTRPALRLIRPLTEDLGR